MNACFSESPSSCFSCGAGWRLSLALAGVFVLVNLEQRLHAESRKSELVIRPASLETYDPFESAAPAPTPRNPFVKKRQAAHVQGAPVKLAPAQRAPVDAAAYVHHSLQLDAPRIALQQQAPTTVDLNAAATKPAPDPCAAILGAPLTEVGINIALPSGDLPTDNATPCWDRINEVGGPFAALRCWPTFVYNWNATCLCHRPLYFEQINLERHGYGCCECVQPAVSAAHFFATIPALPYCMAAQCPSECVYTLGHYRPGSCPPWRHHWPSCDPLAAAAEGGVWTGMIFLIP